MTPPHAARALSLSVALALGTALAGCATTPPGAPDTIASEAATDKAAVLDQLYADYWEELLARNPLQATFQGDPRYNDQLPNFLSAEYRAASEAFTREWLERIEAIGPDGLAGQDLLSYEIF